MAIPPGITFTNPTGGSWTSGNRGKPPAFVINDPKYIELTKANPKSIKSTSTTPATSNPLKCWRWADQLGDEGVKIKTTMCVVAALTPLDALELLKRRFPSNPVSSSEFRLMWKLIDTDGSIQTPGVYEHNQEKTLTLKST
jgi:hypothetical protein